MSVNKFWIAIQIHRKLIIFPRIKTCRGNSRLPRALLSAIYAPRYQHATSDIYHRYRGCVKGFPNSPDCFAGTLASLGRQRASAHWKSLRRRGLILRLSLTKLGEEERGSITPQRVPSCTFIITHIHARIRRKVMTAQISYSSSSWRHRHRLSARMYTSRVRRRMSNAVSRPLCVCLCLSTLCVRPDEAMR